MYKYTENPSVIAGPNGNLIRVGNDNPEYVALVQSGATIEPWMPPPPTDSEIRDAITKERERRLALGFEYDFGDARGVHRIATTRQDMEGWKEVSIGANALLAAGDTTTTITIFTETGSADVTAVEWQPILIAALAARQPLWEAAEALKNMDPIPHDFATNEAYWGG